MVVRHRDRDAARTGAQVERAHHFAIAEPGLEPVDDHFRDGRTRHQRAAIALEAQAREPRLAGEVRGRHALLDAAQEEREDFFLLRLGHAGLAIHRRQVVRQVQGMQRELGGFV
jgi:hypothetical protein